MATVRYKDSTACRNCFRGWWGEHYEGDPCPNCGHPLTLTGTVLVIPRTLWDAYTKDD